MGVCLGLMLDPEVPEAQEAFETDGKCTAGELSTLDAICELAGVTSLSAFVDAGAYDISEEEMEEIPEEYRDQIAPASSEEVGYRDCSELQATITAILSQLESADASNSFSAEIVEEITEDLKMLQKSLAVASEAGAKCMLFLW